MEIIPILHSDISNTKGDSYMLSGPSVFVELQWLGLEGTSGIIKFQLQYTSRTICDFPTIFQRYSLL